MEDLESFYGLVVSYFDLEEYELMVVQDGEGELITLKVLYNGR